MGMSPVGFQHIRENIIAWLWHLIWCWELVAHCETRFVGWDRLNPILILGLHKRVPLFGTRKINSGDNIRLAHMSYERKKEIKKIVGQNAPLGFEEDAAIPVTFCSLISLMFSLNVFCKTIHSGYAIFMYVVCMYFADVEVNMKSKCTLFTCSCSYFEPFIFACYCISNL